MSVNAIMHEQLESDDARCPECQSISVEWKVVTGYVYVGEIEYEQEAEVAKCCDCGASWSS